MLIIPILRGLLSVLGQKDIVEYLMGSYIDIIAISFIITMAIIAYRKNLYRVDERAIYLKKGVFFKKEYTVCYENIPSIVMTTPLFYRLIKAVKLDIESAGGFDKRYAVSIIVSKSEGVKIFEKRKNHIKTAPDSQKRTKIRYISSVKDIVLMSFVLTNVVTGGLVLYATINQVKLVLGSQAGGKITEFLVEISNSFRFGFSPIVSLVLTLVGISWLYSFLANIFKHVNFTLYRQGNFLHIKKGVLSKREYIIKISDINYVDVRESLTTRVFGLCMVFISVMGYGKEKADTNIFIPAVPKKLVEQNLGTILWQKEYKKGLFIKKLLLKPNIFSIIKYVNLAFGLWLIVVVGGYLLSQYYRLLQDAIFWGGIYISLPFFYLFVVQTVYFFKTGVSVMENPDIKGVVLSYCKGYNFHTIILPNEKIAITSLRQSVFQQQDDCCDISFYSKNKKRCVHKIKNLNRQKVVELVLKSL